jgi:hypothetical protein
MDERTRYFFVKIAGFIYHLVFAAVEAAMGLQLEAVAVIRIFFQQAVEYRSVATVIVDAFQAVWAAFHCFGSFEFCFVLLIFI